jgi:hypothetical protein
VAFQVVTIAMMTGASAEQVGRLAAEQLGYQFVNNEILDRAAEHAGGIATGGGRGRALAVTDQPDYVGDWRQRRASRIRRPPVDPGRDRPVSIVSAPHPGRDPRGRGAEERGDPGARREHPARREAGRVARSGDGVPSHASGTGGSRGAGNSERQATREIQHSDRERQSFFKRFHNLDEELPTHYDLVVNTDVLSSEASARIIAHAATSA